MNSNTFPSADIGTCIVETMQISDSSLPPPSEQQSAGFTVVVMTVVTISTIACLSWNTLSSSLLSKSNTRGSPIKCRPVASVSSDRCIVKRLEEEDQNCVVFFGSQSGNSQEIAEKLAREAQSRFSLRCMVADLEEYSYENLSKLPNDTLVFFIMASYGDGEPTDNAAEFYTMLTDEDSQPFQELREAGLRNLQYAAFGLGNSNYAQYNAVIRRIDEQLIALGAQRLAPVGQADDGQGSTEEDFVEWKEKMWLEVSRTMNLPEQEVPFTPCFNVSEKSDYHGPICQGDYTEESLALQQAHASTSHVFAPITEARSLTSGEYRNYLHVEFDLHDSGLSYRTGDHLGISPMNSDIEVERFLRVFGLLEKRDTAIWVEAKLDNSCPSLPSPLTFESAARFYMDICGPVSRQLISMIAKCVQDPHKKSVLHQLGQDKPRFLELTQRKYFTLASFLEYIFPKNPTVNVPFAVLVESISKLQPRYYSISSSSMAESHKAAITVAVESFIVQGTSRYFNGVATNYILEATSKHFNKTIRSPSIHPIAYTPPQHQDTSRLALPIFIRKSTFRLSYSTSVPVLMVGPGTGVAPFRGFVRERIAQLQSGQDIGPLTLFYGCREESEDFLYENEWRTYAEVLGDKFMMYTAFSRKEGHKVYVQDLLQQESERVSHIIQSGGNVYVCGDVRMGRGVYETIGKILAAEAKITHTEAERILLEMKSSYRYQEDVW